MAAIEYIPGSSSNHKSFPAETQETLSLRQTGAGCRPTPCGSNSSLGFHAPYTDESQVLFVAGKCYRKKVDSPLFMLDQ